MIRPSLYVVTALGYLIAAWLFIAVSPASATRLPSDLADDIHDLYPDAKVRLDGAIEMVGGDLFLPAIPNSNFKKHGKAHVEVYFPSQEHPDALFYSNGWSFLKVLNVDRKKTVVLPAQLPEQYRTLLGSSKFPFDLIVPEGFVMPQSLKPLVGDMSIPLVKDESLVVIDGSSSASARKSPEHGMLFLTSINSGSITMLDDHTLNKIAEFPTEGTPSSMDLVDGKLYITDEAKSRVLILDPSKRQFLGQIDLPPHSAPKGIASTPNGELIYVSENGAGDVAIIEAASRKVIMRTRVAAGPGRMTMAPNGNYLIVLNVTVGDATIISTTNQRVVATIHVGSVPTAVAISPDSNTAYISNRMSNSISVIDLNSKTVIANIPTGVGPTGLAISTDGRKLYVANAREDSICVYDLKSRKQIQEAKLPVEIDFPGALRIMPDGKHMVISSEATDNVSLMDLDNFSFDKASSIGHFSHEIIWVPVD